MLSNAEENYLKTLLRLTVQSGNREAGTNELANMLGVKPATANDMLKKLKAKNLVDYERYGKIRLTAAGKKWGIDIVRKHRLWETFLYHKLGFSWDEVHEVAEQLEHIQSAKLIDKLDEFLNFPQYDPHGDPIPSKKGEMKVVYKQTLFDIAPGKHCKMVAVKDNSTTFLKYVVNLGLGLNDKLRVVSKNDFDAQVVIEVDGKKISVSKKFAENIFVI